MRNADKAFLALVLLAMLGAFVIIADSDESDGASYTLSAKDLYNSSTTTYSYPSGTQIKVSDVTDGDLWYSADRNSYQTVPCSVTIDLFDGPEASDDNLIGSKTVSFTVQSSSHTYYLRYNANGGSGAPSTQTASDSSSSHTFTISSTSPSRSGYTFKGWALQSTATSAQYSSGGSISVSWDSDGGDVTLYAVWQQNASTSYTCYLYYNANGGSGAPATQSYTSTSTSSHVFTVSSDTPTRSGYSFLGWSTSSSATSAMYQPGETVSVSYNGTKTLYAVWQQTTSYSVTVYKGNWQGFKVAGVDSDIVTSSSKVYTVVSGSTFDVDWYGKSAESGSGTGYTYTTTYTGSCYNMASSLYGTSLGDSVTVTGTSKYYPAEQMTSTTTYTYQYTIKYNANGGSGAPSDTTMTSSTATKSITLSSTAPTRSGYQFLGWSESSTATTATYSPGTAYTFDYGTTNLYAVWKTTKLTIGTVSKQYAVAGQSVSFGATCSPSDVSVTYTKTSVSSGLTVSINGSTVTCSAASAGTYTFTLKASASGYTTSSTTVTVQFVPVLAFTNAPSIGVIGS